MLERALVGVAKARGYQADYVTHLGKAGWQDWNLVRFAIANDYIIVTDNRRDFLKEYAKLEVHAGLVILLPKGTRDRQMALFQKALDPNGIDRLSTTGARRVCKGAFSAVRTIVRHILLGGAHASLCTPYMLPMR
jgi:predicted nuclease of predicted toxin-antitoxin system